MKYLLQDVVIDYIRANHLYGVEDKWVRAAWIHSRCLFISVQQALHVSNCLPLSLFISFKFIQDCHNSQNFKSFFFCFWKNPSWYVTGIYWMGYTLVTVHEFYLWWSDTFIFIIHFNYTCSMYTNLLVIFWSACSDEFYFCFACFKISHWMSFLSLVLIHVWHVTKGCFFLLLL